MPEGVSVHVGLNAIDPAHYGDDGALGACEFDAKDMMAIAKKQGFSSSTILLTKAATSAAVIGAIQDAAKALSKGDLFLLSYAGHGGQVPDANRDEADGMDETWLLYDRQLVDDELYALFGRFKPGVRIVVVSDSCHSGTVTRMLPPSLTGGVRSRTLPPARLREIARKHQALYTKIQRDHRAADQAKIGASVLLLSGCQDNQLSRDGERNGLFTSMLKKVWKGGSFEGSHRRFRDTIAQKMPPDQTPNYFTVGSKNAAFEAATPFTI